MTTADKILDAAQTRMRKAGYNAVSFRDLAADTVVKSASVHYHFARKEDLGVALVERYHQHFFSALQDRVATADAPEKKVKAICELYRDTLQTDDAICLCGMLGAESPGLPPAVKAAVSQFFQANIDWIGQALQEHLPKLKRQSFATGAVASLQGGMLVATSLSNAQVFDVVIAGVQQNLSALLQRSASKP
jgi:TetR/AcrR family transcriptional regulator, transcriptional repressor for nem operon